MITVSLLLLVVIMRSPNPMRIAGATRDTMIGLSWTSISKLHNNIFSTLNHQQDVVPNPFLENFSQNDV
jgi:hypothetical protein